ncbi:MAG: DUF2493 domain-containing protein [Clostridia bacterium]|nr:DUF2493 domain-containing protein [Clostridia bacterium]
MIKKVLVAGSRNYNDYEEAKAFIQKCINRIEKEYELVFVSGDCRGADKLGEQFALENDYNVEKHPADWERFGKSAGPKRNETMAKVADYIICFWDGRSKGTKSMIDFAKKFNKPIRIKYI